MGVDDAAVEPQVVVTTGGASATDAGDQTMTDNVATDAGSAHDAGNRPAAQDPATPAPGTLSYYRDVKPVFDAKCTQCHVDGGIGGFPLTSYEEVEPRASAIRKVVNAGVMPPWRAAGPLDEYIGDRRLTDAQRSLLVAWVDEGAQRGHQHQEPPHPLPEKRALPRVDAVLQPAAPFTPQHAPDHDRCFVLDWPYQETRYITGLSIEPGRAEMVHYAVVYAVDWLPASNSRELDAADQEPGYDCSGLSVANGSWLTSYERGGYGQATARGIGFRMDPDSALILQVHYNTERGTGPDTSRVSLMLDATVDRVAQVALLYDVRWLFGSMPIPAGAPDAVHRWQGRPVGLSSFASYDLFAVDLHMHRLGRSGSIGIIRAGQPEPLLEIPEWSFEWQETYRFQRPVRLNAEDELYVECHFDNTAARQPYASDAASGLPRDVNWGDRTMDEMCLGNVLAALASE